MTKLIINYTFQKWNSSSYIYPERALILTFKDDEFESITNDKIQKSCGLKEGIESYNITVKSIVKI